MDFFRSIPIFLLDFIIIILLQLSSITIEIEISGPNFIEEPPNRLEFPNSSGSRTLCTGRGNPSPEVEWLLYDGSLVTNIPDLLLVFENGSLIFLPFPVNRFQQNIHSTVYKCRLTNSVGSVISHDVHVTAVTKEKYDINVYDEYVIAGNTAILRCQIPDDMKNYTVVTSWIQDESIHIYPNSQLGGKYMISDNGDLYINNVNQVDEIKSYTCQTLNRLTGKIKTSIYPGRVIVNEPKDIVQPRVTVHKYSKMVVRTGNDVILSCIAQGNPSPVYTWFYDNQPIQSSDKISILRIGLLKISKVNFDNKGLYVCWANNTAGGEKIEFLLEVLSPLSVRIHPEMQAVDLSRDALFQCFINGYPVEHISWLHNGNILYSNEKYHIDDKDTSVSTLIIKQLTKDSRGMYQCMVSNYFEQVQMVAELNLGNSSPELTYKFSEQTLQPGPTVSLKCVATGHPLPQFTWLLDGFPVPDHPRFLVGQFVTVHDDVISHVNISNIQSEDGGEYTCFADNGVAKIYHCARVNVYGTPYIREMPKITAISNSDLVIKCPVAGYPIDSINWERDAQILPLNRRHKVYTNGTLIIEQIEKTQDSGTYTCQAKNRHNNIARRNVEIQVIIPPKILPIQSMANLLREGMRTAISCQILEGDLPIDFTWLKNNQSINENDLFDIQIRRLDEYSSSLIIDQINSSHNGDYTCIASNLAGSDNVTVPLTVNVPPQWIIEPSDKNVIFGQHLVLNCKANGYPNPVINWKKAISINQSNPSGEYKEFLFESNIKQFSNGSIRFQNITKENEGHYLCEAKNSIGSGVSKVIYLKVNVPVKFVKKTKQIYSTKGEKAHLQCTVFGDKPIELRWKFPNKNEFFETFLEKSRFKIREQHLAEGMLSELTISKVARQDSGYFYCYARNSYGQDELNIQLIIQEIPEAPKNIQILHQESNSITLEWSQPYEGNNAILNYIIQFKLGSELWSQTVSKLSVAGSIYNITLDSLKPAQVYYIRIFAENRIGLSDPSPVIQVNTLEEVPTSVPLSIKTEAISPTEILISWKLPNREGWNGNLLGFLVGFQPIFYNSITNQNYSFKRVDIETRDENMLKTTINGLLKFTYYTIVVKAYNSRGSGPESDAVTVRTLEDIPSAPPERLQCSIISSRVLKINWEPPLLKFRNGVIKGYKMFFYALNKWFENDSYQTKVTSLLQATLSNLRKFTNYSISVLSYTSVGDGVKSEPIFCQTDEDVPSEPEDIKAVMSTSNKIVVSWLPPIHKNGIIVSYTLYVSTLKFGQQDNFYKRILNPNTEMYEATRLHDSLSYQFWVTAMTRIGEGDSSKVVSVLPSSLVPAKIVSFGQLVVTAWKQDVKLLCKHVGIPTASIIWQHSGQTVDNSKKLKVLNDGSLLLRNVNIIDEANYTCYIENQYGSDEITYSLSVLVPPEAPELLTSETTITSIHLEWRNRVQNKIPIIGYIVNYKHEQGDWKKFKIMSRTESFLLRDLSCGCQYHIFITAFNEIGSGIPSNTVKAQTKGSAPIKPTASKLITFNSTAVTIWLDLWKDGGCIITHFTIEYRASQNSQWNLLSNYVNPNEQKYSITDLWSSTLYFIRVTAHNNAGQTTGIYNFSTPTTAGVNMNMYKPKSIPEENYFQITTEVLLPILASVIFLITIIAMTCFHFRKKGNSRPIMNTSSLSRSDAIYRQNHGEHYVDIRRNPSQSHSTGNERRRQSITLDSDSYKMSDLNSLDEVCPYATFQLPKHLDPTENCYSGNIYSGPYNSLQQGAFVYHNSRKFKNEQKNDHEYTKVKQNGSRLRQPYSEGQESDNLGSTDSEVKRILTLHRPISENDTITSDSDVEDSVTSEDLLSFSRRKNKAKDDKKLETSSTSSEMSSDIDRRKSYVPKKLRSKGQSLTERRYIRNGSHNNDETSFTLFRGSLTKERSLNGAHFFSNPDNKRSKTVSNRDSFQINV